MNEIRWKEKYINIDKVMQDLTNGDATPAVYFAQKLDSPTEGEFANKLYETLYAVSKIDDEKARRVLTISGYLPIFSYPLQRPSPENL